MASPAWRGRHRGLWRRRDIAAYRCTIKRLGDRDTDPAVHTKPHAKALDVDARTKTGGPKPRRDHSLTFNADDGRMYLFGGRTAGVADNELWMYDPMSASWQEAPASGTGPPARFAHNAMYDRAGKRLVVTLGQGNGSAFFSNVLAYDGESWTQLDVPSAERPAIRYGSGGALDPAANRLLITHGFTDVGRFDDTWPFDLGTGAWQKITTAGAVPIKRCLTRCLWLATSRELLLFGGQTDDNPFLGDEWTLSLSTGVWTEHHPAILPGPRNLYGAATSLDGEQWYVVGGNTAVGPNAEVWSYNLASAAWTQIKPEGATPSARYSSDAAFAGDGLYLFGGHDGSSEIGDLWLPRSDVA